MDILMFYDAELAFVRQFLENSHLPCHIVTAASLPGQQPDMGLRRMLGVTSGPESFSALLENKIQDNRVYQIIDEFMCNYFLLRLPEAPENTIMMIGPFLTRDMDRPALLELSEKYSLSPQLFPFFEKYFSTVPMVADNTPLLTVLHTFAQKIWGGTENFTLEFVEQGVLADFSITTSPPRTPESDDSTFSMHALESRYANENALLQAVSQGQVHKAEVFAGTMSLAYMEQRSPDSLRNLKNYTIILNTLLRKAAEQGSVHPYHIDSLSSDFARKIELSSTPEACAGLQKEMIRKYCLLVKNHSMKGYSLLIQRVITRIDSDLTANLSLNAIATLLKVNPSYLSSQFKKETGSTLTDFVNKRKVEHAILLLNSTPLQIQTIALHCGIPDVNYFTKLFKKYINKTPKEYRDSIS